MPLRTDGKRMKKLRSKEIASVKMIWGGPVGENANWELGSRMREFIRGYFSR
ncbi:hypothetical protein A2U01_0059069, partial [Trifolium medium]|nr:hypothetical protein [Trifolium medium]